MFSNNRYLIDIKCKYKNILTPIKLHSASSVRIPYSINNFRTLIPAVRLRPLNVLSASSANLHGLANTSIFHNNLRVMLSPLKSSIRSTLIRSKDLECILVFRSQSWLGPELFCLLLGPPGFNCWFSFAPVFQWCCLTPQGSPSVGRNTFLASPHLCFIVVFICDLFVSRDDPLMG